MSSGSCSFACATAPAGGLSSRTRAAQPPAGVRHQLEIAVQVGLGHALERAPVQVDAIHAPEQLPVTLLAEGEVGDAVPQLEFQPALDLPQRRDGRRQGIGERPLQRFVFHLREHHGDVFLEMGREAPEADDRGPHERTRERRLEGGAHLLEVGGERPQVCGDRL